MKKEERYHTFWKYVLLVMGSILALISLLATVFSSFKTTRDIMQHFFALPSSIILGNYTRLLAGGIGHYFWNSAITIVVSVILITLFIPVVAYSIAHNMSKKHAFNIMYNLLVLGIFVLFQAIMIPITVAMSRLGLTNIWGLIILYLTYAIPRTLFLYVGYTELSVPESLDEAAEIDRTDKFITYHKVVFPMLKPMYVATLIINTLWFQNDFVLPPLILNKPSGSWLLPLSQYNYIRQCLSGYGPSFVSYVVGIITTTTVYLIFQKYIISGMNNGAVK